jgi:hypothetical protein
MRTPWRDSLGRLKEQSQGHSPSAVTAVMLVLDRHYRYRRGRLSTAREMKSVQMQYDCEITIVFFDVWYLAGEGAE